jgi:uncharacterized protein YlzI (FlbEa/FlbD family)
MPFKFKSPNGNDLWFFMEHGTVVQKDAEDRAGRRTVILMHGYRYVVTEDVDTVVQRFSMAPTGAKTAGR